MIVGPKPRSGDACYFAGKQTLRQQVGSEREKGVKFLGLGRGVKRKKCEISIFGGEKNSEIPSEKEGEVGGQSIEPLP